MVVSMTSTSSSTTAYVKVTLKDKPESSQAADISAQVKFAEVEDNDRLIDKATILMDDTHGASSVPLKEGVIITVDMGWVAEHGVVFQGVITNITPEIQSNKRQVKVIAFDLSYQMKLGNKTTPPYLGKLSSIIQKIVEPYAATGIQIGQIKVDPDPTLDKAHALVPVNKKDWEFIQDLAEAHRARAYVEYNSGASRFYFHPESLLLKGDPMGVLHYCYGFSQLIEFKPQRIASGAAPQRTATVANSTTGDTVQTAPPPPSTPGKPDQADPTLSARLAKLSPTAASNLEQATTLLANPTAPDQHPQVSVSGSPSDETLPQRVGRQDPTRILGQFGQGLAIGTIMLRAKGKVTIHGIESWADGNWYVRVATHVYTRVMDGTKDRSTYRTKFMVTR